MHDNASIADTCNITQRYVGLDHLWPTKRTTPIRYERLRIARLRVRNWLPTIYEKRYVCVLIVIAAKALNGIDERHELPLQLVVDAMYVFLARHPTLQ